MDLMTHTVGGKNLAFKPPRMPPIDTHLTHRIDDVVTLCVRDAFTRKALQQQSQTHR
jgi:hypothetical protein